MQAQIWEKNDNLTKNAIKSIIFISFSILSNIYSFSWFMVYKENLLFIIKIINLFV